MRINRVFNKLLGFKAPQETGFITLQSKQGNLTVPIGRYTDHSVKNARIDSRELNLALFR